MNAIEVDILAGNWGFSPPLQAWGWEIAIYLFLGGLVAGLMILSGLARRQSSESRSLGFWAPVLAPVLLSAGMFALFLDLEHKLNLFRFYTTFQVTSPMSWGSWILILVLPAQALSVLLAIEAPKQFAVRVAPFARHIGSANMVLGVALGIYTGVLLGSLGARPLWNTPLLGPLFLVSGMSAAAALLVLLEPSAEARHRLAILDLKLIAAEAGILLLLLFALSAGGAAQRQAALLFLGGDFTAVFWVLVVMTGLALPATLEILERTGKAQQTVYAPVLVLIGGIALRAVVLFAGQLSHWENL